MKRWKGCIAPLVIGASLLCGYVAPQDRQYVDYFLRLHAAELFRKRAFVLQSCQAYVSQRQLERVDIRFVCYRTLSQDQARRLFVSIAQDLLTKINADSTLKEKQLVTKVFRPDQLHLELRTDNVFSRESDTETIQRIILEGNVITYRTYNSATLFHGQTETFKETYQEALILLDEPTEYDPEGSKPKGRISNPNLLPMDGVHAPEILRGAVNPHHSEITQQQKPIKVLEPPSQAQMRAISISEPVSVENINSLGTMLPEEPPQEEAPKKEELVGMLENEILTIFPGFTEPPKKAAPLFQVSSFPSTSKETQQPVSEITFPTPPESQSSLQPQQDAQPPQDIQEKENSLSVPQVSGNAESISPKLSSVENNQEDLALVSSAPQEEANTSQAASSLEPLVVSSPTVAEHIASLSQQIAAPEQSTTGTSEDTIDPESLEYAPEIPAPEVLSTTSTPIESPVEQPTTPNAVALIDAPPAITPPTETPVVEEQVVIEQEVEMPATPTNVTEQPKEALETPRIEEASTPTLPEEPQAPVVSPATESVAPQPSWLKRLITRFTGNQTAPQQPLPEQATPNTVALIDAPPAVTPPTETPVVEEQATIEQEVATPEASVDVAPQHQEEIKTPQAEETTTSALPAEPQTPPERPSAEEQAIIKQEVAISTDVAEQPKEALETPRIEEASTPTLPEEPQAPVVSPSTESAAPQPSWLKRLITRFTGTQVTSQQPLPEQTTPDTVALIDAPPAITPPTETPVVEEQVVVEQEVATPEASVIAQNDTPVLQTEPQTPTERSSEEEATTPTDVAEQSKETLETPPIEETTTPTLPEEPQAPVESPATESVAPQPSWLKRLITRFTGPASQQPLPEQTTPDTVALIDAPPAITPPTETPVVEEQVIIEQEVEMPATPTDVAPQPQEEIKTPQAEETTPDLPAEPQAPVESPATESVAPQPSWLKRLITRFTGTQVTSQQPLPEQVTPNTVALIDAPPAITPPTETPVVEEQAIIEQEVATPEASVIAQNNTPVPQAEPQTPTERPSVEEQTVIKQEATTPTDVAEQPKEALETPRIEEASTPTPPEETQAPAVSPATESVAPQPSWLKRLITRFTGTQVTSQQPLPEQTTPNTVALIDAPPAITPPTETPVVEEQVVIEQEVEVPATPTDVAPQPQEEIKTSQAEETTPVLPAEPQTSVVSPATESAAPQPSWLKRLITKFGGTTTSSASSSKEEYSTQQKAELLPDIPQDLQEDQLPFDELDITEEVITPAPQPKKPSWLRRLIDRVIPNPEKPSSHEEESSIVSSGVEKEVAKEESSPLLNTKEDVSADQQEETSKTVTPQPSLLKRIFGVFSFQKTQEDPSKTGNEPEKQTVQSEIAINTTAIPEENLNASEIEEKRFQQSWFTKLVTRMSSRDVQHTATENVSQIDEKTIQDVTTEPVAQEPMKQEGEQHKPSSHKGPSWLKRLITSFSPTTKKEEMSTQTANDVGSETALVAVSDAPQSEETTQPQESTSAQTSESTPSWLSRFFSFFMKKEEPSKPAVEKQVEEVIQVTQEERTEIDQDMQQNFQEQKDPSKRGPSWLKRLITHFSHTKKEDDLQPTKDETPQPPITPAESSTPKSQPTALRRLIAQLNGRPLQSEDTVILPKEESPKLVEEIETHSTSTKDAVTQQNDPQYESHENTSASWLSKLFSSIKGSSNVTPVQEEVLQEEAQNLENKEQSNNISEPKETPAIATPEAETTFGKTISWLQQRSKVQKQPANPTSIIAFNDEEDEMVSEAEEPEYQWVEKLRDAAPQDSEQKDVPEMQKEKLPWYKKVFRWFRGSHTQSSPTEKESSQPKEVEHPKSE